MAGDEFEFDLEAPDLRGLITHVKEFDPKLATGLRRELRGVGDSAIGKSRSVLSGRLPGSLAVDHHEFRLVVPKNGRKPYMAKRIVWKVGDDKGSGGVGKLREQISRGLRTRVVAGKSRQSISIKTTGPRNAGYNMARTWGKKRFRHPVWGHGWMYQQGQDYFWGPVREQTTQMQDHVADIIDDALQRLAQH